MGYQFTYENYYQKKNARESAEHRMNHDKKMLKLYEKWGSIYPNEYHVSLFDPHMQIPENETNFKHTWKTKLHDLIYLGHIQERCPIGGLILTHENMFDKNSPPLISTTQPGVDGLDTPFERHSYVFTKEWHPRNLEALWKKWPEGSFLTEYGVYTKLKKTIKEAAEQELAERKFIYYLKYWEQWCYDATEFYYKSPTFCVDNVAKAEAYVEKCLQEGKGRPFPEYRKEDDPYWKYRKPTGYEVLFKERTEHAKHEMKVFFGTANDYTDASKFINVDDLSRSLSADDWRSQKTLERVFASFPFLDKQILDPNAPEFAKRMKLVDEILRQSPKFAPGRKPYDEQYFRSHTDQNVQEWAWRLGALMNAFAPEDPMKTQTTRMILSIYFGKKECEKIGPGVHTIWADTQYTAIDNLLHCDNVDKLYGSWFAMKTSSIMCTNNQELQRYLKIMELNHNALYGDGKPLFSERDQVRIQNYMKLREAYVKYENLDKYVESYDAISPQFRNVHKITCHRSYALWDPETVSVRTTLPLSQKSNKKDSDPLKCGIHVLFSTPSEHYQQIGSMQQTMSRFFRSYEEPGYTPLHRNIFLNDPRYEAALAMSMPMQNESVGLCFFHAPEEIIVNNIKDNKDVTSWKDSNLSLVVDFNDYSKLPKGKESSDRDVLTEFVPNANMDELIGFIPKLVESKVPFTITDTGYLVLYAMGKQWCGNPLVRLITENLEVFGSHYITTADAYMMGQTKMTIVDGMDVTSATEDSKIDMGPYHALHDLLRFSKGPEYCPEKYHQLDERIPDLFRHCDCRTMPNMKDVLALKEELSKDLDEYPRYISDQERKAAEQAQMNLSTSDITHEDVFESVKPSKIPEPSDPQIDAMDIPDPSDNQ